MSTNTAFAEKLKACASGDGAKQYALDLISTFILMQSGFVSNPRFNELNELTNPKDFYHSVQDEFRQINTYIVERCMEQDLIHERVRFTDGALQQIVIDFGMDYAEMFFVTKQLPKWEEATKLFDDLVIKHVNKITP